MDIGLIAEALAATLAPTLPYLVKAGSKAVEAAAGEVGKAAVKSVPGKVKEIWEKIGPRIEARPAAAEAVEDLAKRPDDARARGAVELQLEKILEADPSLLAEVANLLEAAGVRVGVQGSGAAAVGNGAVAGGEGANVAGRDLTQIDRIDIHLGEGAARAGRDETSLRRAYLGRLIAQTEILPLGGIDPAAVASNQDPQLKLHAVYTALLTRSSRLEVGLAQRESREVTLSALEQLDRYRTLVLLGDPGSGKSTFVNFVALCLAGEALGLPEANLALLTSPLPKERGGRDGGPQPWRHGGLLPVRVVLRDFAAKGLPAESSEPATARCLWDFLERELEDAGHAGFFPILQAEILAGRGLVLLDGLDEVPEAQRRREQIRQAVQEFAMGVGESRVLVTSRTYAYQNQAWRLPGFEASILAPFSHGQIDRFVGLWYEQRVALGKITPEEAKGRGELLRRAIFASDRLLGLAERPLLLTLMASLHAWRGGSLPERREELYADAVELLLNTWERQRMRLDASGSPLLAEPSLAEWLKVDREAVRRVLEETAFKAHGAQPDLAGTADVDEGKLVTRLLHLNPERQEDAVKLVEYLRDRSGLLVERGEGVYTLPHRTFQEYLAACHLTGGSFPDEVAELGRKEPGRWREVVLLAGAKAARGAVSSVWSLAETLCPQEPLAPPRSGEDEWGALLAGQAVVESADLARVGKAHEPKLARLRQWMIALMRAEHFPAIERAVAGKALAMLGDLRFDPERWYLPAEPLLGFVEVPAGVFLMGSDKAEDPGAFKNELPRHEVTLSRYWMARYPVTVGQFRTFVEASGYPVEDVDSLEGAANQPVVNVSWEEAMAYCGWLNERLREVALERQGGGEDASAPWADLAAERLRVSLPSEAEWEKAARGTDGRTYPWGRKADPNRANYDETGLLDRSIVGCFPGGASVYGCEEMSGNVWEWTRSAYRGYPYVSGEGRENAAVSPQVLRVLRGGAFDDSSRSVRCAYRIRLGPDDGLVFIGFRVVLSPFPL